MCGSRVEAVGLEIVRAQVLSIIIGRDVVNVDLITFLDVVEEELMVGEEEDELLHSLS